MKAKIPGALREQVWMTYCGDKLFRHKCLVSWCENIITPFRFEVGHNLPESKGGTLDIDNLRPICANCNKSMGNRYTIEEFGNISKRTNSIFECFRFSKNPPDAQKSSFSNQTPTSGQKLSAELHPHS